GTECEVLPPLILILSSGEDKMESVDVSDGNSGEYECRKDNDIKTIFIKFRCKSTREHVVSFSGFCTVVVLISLRRFFAACDNCVELDVLSVTGLIFGEVLATLAIAISVHLLAKHCSSYRSSSSCSYSPFSSSSSPSFSSSCHY
uniref:Uncharacterized protein n=1 Tax=Periophthalmus magnuspinnatus TaxID=409849 RepID=A0A3B3ZUF1_9GOBI